MSPVESNAQNRHLFLTQLGLNQRPVAPFRCPFPWIPAPLGAIGDVGIREDGGPTATEGGEENRAGM